VPAQVALHGVRLAAEAALEARRVAVVVVLVVVFVAVGVVVGAVRLALVRGQKLYENDWGIELQ
jgi:hypothetical protein